MAGPSTQDYLKDIESQLTCLQCKQTFKQPKLLLCFHVFCESPCLDKLMNNESITCPTCGDTTTPTGEVSGLPSDPYTDNLLQIKQLSDKVEEGNTRCGSNGCENAKATGYCQECEELVCDECRAVHKRFKVTSFHQIISLREFHTQPIRFAPSRKAIPKCPRHTENVLEYYCETCSVPICRNCTVKMHKEDDYDVLDDVFPKVKDELIASREKVKGKLMKACQEISSCDNKINRNKQAM